jgi:hypothetical protein
VAADLLLAVGDDLMFTGSAFSSRSNCAAFNSVKS